MKKYILNVLSISLRLRIFSYLHRVVSNQSLDYLLAFLMLPFSFIIWVADGIISLLFNPNKIKKNVAIVTIIKNEAPYIAEWLSYYKILGVDNVILYNNESSDNLKDVVTPFIKDGFVILKDLKGKKRQFDAYNLSICKYKRKYKYLAMIDADEFIYSFNHNAVNEIISVFEKDKKNIAGLAINWMCYGSANREEAPTSGLVIENYLYHAIDDFERNDRIKTILNPRKTAFFRHAHYPIYKFKRYAVNTKGDRVDGAISKTVDYSTIRLNHYMTKSKAEYIEKCNRGMADQKIIRSIEPTFSIFNKNDIYDDSMLYYADKIKEVLNNFS